MSNLGWTIYLVAGVVLEASAVLYKKKTLSEFTWQKTWKDGKRHAAWYFLLGGVLWAGFHLLRLFGFEAIP